MKQRLYLLRHAEAEPWSPLGNDFSRSLSSSGTRHAQLVADWALETLAQPDTIICSPAKRTRETLAPLLSQWPKLLATTDYVDSMYNATLSMLLTLVEDAFSYSERLFMIGHNPGLPGLMIKLLKEDQAAGIQRMPPGTLAVIEFPGNFKRNTRNGELLHLIEKKDLSDH